MGEVLTYRGYKIDLQPFGRGWRAAIYAPGATLAESSIPYSSEQASRTGVLDEARAIIDRLIGSP